MEKERKVNLLDYLVILVKWKKFLVLLLLPTLIITYLAIYFLIEEQYDANALIIPAEDQSLGGFASLLSGLGNNLPIDIGGGVTSQEMTLYNTIIYSRTNLEKVIDKFDLINIYKLSKEDKGYKEKAIEILSGCINASENEEMAYEIEVRANSPKLASDMTNYIVELLIEKLIELRTQKSKNNRIFLEGRIAEIRDNLRMSEDSLMIFQKETRLLSPEDQLGGIISAYSELETQLATKQIEKSIMKELRGKDSPITISLAVEVEEFEKKLMEMKKKGDPEGLIPALSSLPQNAINYFRFFREVEINNAILEFIIPLYEQAKLEEKKDVPSLQVIDYAVPPTKKSFPPRVLFSLIVTFGVFIVAFSLILIRENEEIRNSNKVKYIRNNLFRWKANR